MSDDASSTLKSIGIFSTLQAATEVKFFLLSASFVLMVDNTFLFLKQPGLFELATNKTLFESTNFALIVTLIFVVFSFLTSLILPVLAFIFDWILIQIVGRSFWSIDAYLDKKFGIDYVPKNREVDRVTPRELKIAAHTTKEKYLLDLYKDYETEWWKEGKNTFQFVLYAFYSLVMLCINFYMGYMSQLSVSYILTNFFGTTGPIWIAIILLIAAISLRLFKKREQEWIYCPSLYEELQTKGHKKILPG